MLKLNPFVNNYFSFTAGNGKQNIDYLNSRRQYLPAAVRSVTLNLANFSEVAK